MIRTGLNRFLVACLALALAGCATVPVDSASQRERQAIADAMRATIDTLSSDAMQGRLPGSEGDQRTTYYIAQAMKDAGLVTGTNDPANPWLAPVELTRSTPGIQRLELERSGSQTRIVPRDALVFTRGKRALVDGAPVLFVGGSGPVPEAAELMGRIALSFADSPGGFTRRDALHENGAAGVITVVPDEDALQYIAQRQRIGGFHLASEDNPTLDAYVTQSALAASLGERAWGRLVEEAGKDGFVPHLMPWTATLEASSTEQPVTSYNVIGRIPGTDPAQGAVLLLAHWDHLGLCRQEGEADRICNGAVDNASGVALMLELAKRLAAAEPRQPRDIYVLATTAEESGLLGARAFAQNPPIPLPSIVAAFNFDTVAVAPEGSPIGIVGEGRTALDPVIRETAASMGRRFGEPEIAEGYVRRQDGWALLQRDVPTVMISSSFGVPLRLEDYTRRFYHQPGDEAAGVELGGAVDDLLLHYELVRKLADPAQYPVPVE